MDETDLDAPIHVLLLGLRKGRALRLRRTSHGRLCVEAGDEIHDRWVEAEPQRLAPRRHRRAQSATVAEGADLERLKRFAQDVAQWLAAHAPPPGSEPLVVFAPPRLLGLLRQALPAVLAGGLELLQGHYVDAALSQLSRHPALTALLPRGAAGRTTRTREERA